MDTNKILVAAGCSFTQFHLDSIEENWPVSLGKELNYHTFYEGAGAAGNDFICRRLIHRLINCLKEYNPEDILVGVMWSGVTRKSVILQNTGYSFKFFNGNAHFQNPNNIAEECNHYFLHPYWDDELSTAYYKHFFDELGSYVYTIENILKAQWFLKLNKIKYFFTTHHESSFDGSNFKQYHDNPEVKYLLDEIDFSNFLPISNMDDWNRNESGFTYHDRNPDHPTPEMSRKFTETIILPHLKSKGYID